MKILVERRKGDFFVEMEEDYPTDNYLEAIKMALEKHSDAGYAVCRVKKVDGLKTQISSLEEESNLDPKN